MVWFERYILGGGLGGGEESDCSINEGGGPCGMIQLLSIKAQLCTLVSANISPTKASISYNVQNILHSLRVHSCALMLNKTVMKLSE